MTSRNGWVEIMVLWSMQHFVHNASIAAYTVQKMKFSIKDFWRNP